MTRVVVVGPRDMLERTIETLHEVKALHIVDHQPEEGMGIGKPLPQASEASEDLVKLRSIRSILAVDRPPGPTPGTTETTRREEIRQRILTLELNISEEEEARKKTEGLLGELDRRIEALRPLTTLPLRLEDYRGYESLAVFVGWMPRELEGLDDVTTAYELFRGDGVAALFVRRQDGDAVQELLLRRGFQLLDVPEGTGNPKALLKDLEEQRARWGARLEESEDRLFHLRERYADFLLAAEEVLEEEVEKAEAPLRFAVSDHSFVADGWVPSSAFPRMRDALDRLGRLHVASIEGDGTEPPVKLQNPKPVKPFEMLIHLFSTPRYEELDPTAVVFVVFPLFFGLMIGDVGYGIAMTVIALLLRKKVRSMPDFSDLLFVLALGGLFAALFGWFLYGEAFGVPFYAPKGTEEASWSALFGLSFLPHPVFEKLFDVVDLLLLSILASFIHLAVGFVFGFVNEIRHNRKHAAAKVGWMLVLLGLSYFLFFTAYVLSGETNRVASYVVTHPTSPFAYLPRDAVTQFGLPLSFSALGLLFGGVAILLPTEGGFAVVEIISLLANMVSYTRIAGVAVAKGSVALAFNSMLLPFVFAGDLLMLVVGFVLLFLAHAMIFILGAISASIQGIRLNYVEFFLKFYKGGGTRFRPFGVSRAMATEV
jgi:V/A-type H+-transporting ATPase subunit I